MTMRYLFLLAGASVLSSPSQNAAAFVPSVISMQRSLMVNVLADPTVAVEKPTGTSFLPEETRERAAAGSPVEKVKMEKDGTSAFIDVYEYARKIREGEMTWEEVEKGDLDTVSYFSFVECLARRKFSCCSSLSHLF